MTTMNALIDKAAKVCGSRYALAKAIGIDLANLQKMADGKRPVPPGIAALMAELTGDDPREAACYAVMLRAKDKGQREKLQRLFSRAGEVATLLLCIACGFLAWPADTWAASSQVDSVYIVLCGAAWTVRRYAVQSAPYVPGALAGCPASP
jgi:hypothetical protein